MQNNKLTHTAIFPYLILLISTFCVLTETPSWAGTENSTYHTAKSLLHQNKTHEAYDLLWQALMEDPGDTELNFLYGKVAMELKFYESASAAYDRILMVNPNYTLARLQLGITYYKLGNYSLAEEELKKVIEAKPSKEIKTSAKKYLQTIKKKKSRHQMRLTVRAGRQYNTNVNAGLDDDVIDTVDGPKRLKSNSTEQEDWGTVLDLNARHWWDFGSRNAFLWQSRFDFLNTFYDQENDYNRNFLKLTTGLNYIDGPKYSVYVPFTIDMLYYGSEYYSRACGIAPKVDWHHSQNFMTRWSAVVQHQVYPDHRKRDGAYSSAGIMPRFYWNERKYMFQWHCGYEWKWAKEDIKAYEGLKSIMAFHVYFNKRFQSLITFDYRDRRYDKRQRKYDKTRRNKRYKAKVKFFTPLPWQGLRAVLSFEYTHDDSNIETYDYSRKRTALMLEKRF
jgi:tetratricopeptide (TPR) repeat protein